MKNYYRLLQGDCMDVLPDMQDESIDLVLTDPPYKVSQTYGGGTDADNLINVASIIKTVPHISRVLKTGKFAVFFYDNRILPFLFEASRDTDLVYRRSIYLYRRWGNANRWMGWMQCTDPICFFVKGHSKPFSPKVKGRVHHDCYVKKGPEKEGTGHPAQKPLNIIKDIVLWCSNQYDTVLDPYLGCGVVMKACQILNRNCIGIEIRQEYCRMVEHYCSSSSLLSPSESVAMDVSSV